MRDISLTDALAACAANRVATGEQTVPVAAAAGRVLAREVVARVDLPSADTAAMDGLAVRSADTPGTLATVGEHRAGHPGHVALGPGQAARISTGAVLPGGADAVVRREEVGGTPEAATVPGVPPGRDVRRRGEVIGAGEVLLPAGVRIAPTAVTALGAVGMAELTVTVPPRVAVIGVGDELVPLGVPLRPGQVYDSNRVGVAAQLAAAGAEVISSTSVGDDRDATVQAIHTALGMGADMVVTVGGVSAGDHDHVRPAMRALGAEEVFRGVRVVPCRPLWLGRRDHVVLLGLPGNPASAGIALHLFGRVLLGHPAHWAPRAPLAVHRSPGPGMAQVLRCALRDGVLHPLRAQGAHAVTTMALADALALVEGDTPAGTPVPWSPMGPA
ncbi:MAG: molybdopterin molybdotransferase MoeA [Thermoleophilia bacterium]|nr:molybdopterin molybdotransferase MoeA [Thermoleophilia bacterium]